MKVKIDENLSLKHKKLLQDRGYDVATVYDQKLQGCPDSKLWKQVREEKRFFITLDTGFADIRHLSGKPNPGILLIRSSRKGSKNISEILKRVIEEVPLESMKNCIVVADEKKTRIRPTS